jgi:hypothetical protein
MRENDKKVNYVLYSFLIDLHPPIKFSDEYNKGFAHNKTRHDSLFEGVTTTQQDKTAHSLQ